MFKRAITLIGIAILLAAAAARLAGINFQLWLDEIWSIRLAQTAGSISGIIVLHHDNNHWLNTIYLYLIGVGRPWWMYHLLSEATGIGTVLIGWLLARGKGVWEGLAALLLLASSEFLIEFSTDARGYAPAGFFAMSCALLLATHLERPRRWTVVLLAPCGVLGILSHLTFVVILAGLIASSIMALARSRPRLIAIAEALIWWAVPLAMIITLYYLNIRHMDRGGGPQTPDDLAAQGAAMILGIPIGARAAAVCGGIAFLLCAVRVRRMFRAADPLWPLFLTALLFVPFVLLLLPHSNYIHPRYVYVAVPILLTAMGIELGSWLHGRAPARFAAALLLAGFVAVNGLALVNLLRLGRGDYLDALHYLIDHTTNPAIVVGTEPLHPISTYMVLQYYDNYHVASGKPLLTLSGEDWAGQWPQWLIAEEDYGPSLVTSDGIPFVRRAFFPTGAVTSGISWTIYESADKHPHVRPEDLRTLDK